jgi:hypothetical protein
LKKALDEVLVEELGFSERDDIWLRLWRNYGITLDDLTTLEKMQNTMQLMVGGRAKLLTRAAFARYLREAKVSAKSNAVEESH